MRFRDWISSCNNEHLVLQNEFFDSCDSAECISSDQTNVSLDRDFNVFHVIDQKSDKIDLCAGKLFTSMLFLSCSPLLPSFSTSSLSFCDRNQSLGFCMTIRMKSLSGATMISCFLERTRKKVRSLPGSKSRTTLRALSDNWLINPAYWTVVELSNVLFTGMPEMVNWKFCFYGNYLATIKYFRFQRIYLLNIDWTVFHPCCYFCNHQRFQKSMQQLKCERKKSDAYLHCWQRWCQQHLYAMRFASEFLRLLETATKWKRNLQND